MPSVQVAIDKRQAIKTGKSALSKAKKSGLEFKISSGQPKIPTGIIARPRPQPRNPRRKPLGRNGRGRAPKKNPFMNSRGEVSGKPTFGKPKLKKKNPFMNSRGEVSGKPTFGKPKLKKKNPFMNSRGEVSGKPTSRKPRAKKNPLMNSRGEVSGKPTFGKPKLKNFKASASKKGRLLTLKASASNKSANGRGSVAVAVSVPRQVQKAISHVVDMRGNKLVIGADGHHKQA